MFAAKNDLLTLPSGGYTISRSVRLRSSASAYLTRTPASAGNQKTWTWSGWVKRGSLAAANQIIFSSDSGTSNTTFLEFGFDSNHLFYVSSYTTDVASTIATFRDPSAWYHIVVQFDSTQATAANRCRIYFNGVQQTLTGAGFTLNATYGVNTTQAHDIGRRNWPSGVNFYCDLLITEINFIDGQALTPSSFGSTNALTGVWQPAKYTGTYGTNGFYLNFSDNSNNTATTIGKDYSGNGNNWTPNNISVTAGATYDSMTDVPTLTSATAANYCVLNAIALPSPTASISDGNLTATVGRTGVTGVYSTMGVSTGKWYWEVTYNSGYVNALCIGVSQIGNVSTSAGAGLFTTNSVGYYASSGNVYNNSSSPTAYGATYTYGDVISVALDATAGTVTFYKNNVSQGTLTLPTQISPWMPVLDNGASGGTQSASVNYGQQPWKYTPPSGFVGLNTYNLPASTITNGAAYMAATLYTGNGSTQSITNTVNGISFQPDYVWLKSRSTADNNQNQDSVRGATKRLFSNLTDAESTSANSLTSFNSNGFSVGADANYNGSGYSFVAWQWKAGGSSSSNTNGSITSTVSVGATQGFSVVTFTGVPVNTSTSTIGHGLGVAPSFIILKNRDAVDDWYCQHVSLGASARISLNTTAAAVTGAGSWGNTSPTSTVFTIANNAFTTSTSQKLVAYCFAAVKGFSAFGSYTGNGSADGPFVYTGFRPRWVMIKLSSSAGGNWIMIDTSRDTYNLSVNKLGANVSDAENGANVGNSTQNTLDVLSNGFKLRAIQTDTNGSGNTYIYAAFAESPFKTSLAR